MLYIYKKKYNLKSYFFFVYVLRILSYKKLPSRSLDVIMSRLKLVYRSKNKNKSSSIKLINIIWYEQKTFRGAILITSIILHKYIVTETK